MARDLLGCVLETRINGARTAGRIGEVEAYVGPDDPAAHGYGWRRTARNAALFGRPGTCYVYFVYGAHWCVNAVTECEDYPAAVLIRALEPVAGITTMQRRRRVRAVEQLCAGPGRLCQALGIGRRHNGALLSGPAIRILERSGPPEAIAAGPRIGVSRAADWPLRFCVKDSPWLSRPAPTARS